ncbi:hypothetical protein CBER1_07909 [Cercospora berteroae]|uniref:SH3 domain-containing protein n=1 Tax=Cercospora berteroae TaxID=357750 RepID=A0A2S6BUE7_9PEZI|nr:hypothetical protein CBER1_07909 [Cercospora berteroae]
MRLLNITTLEFQTFGDGDRPPYAIASHRWEGKETTYNDMLRDRGASSDGYLKIVGFCNLVNRMNTQIGPARALNDLGLRRQCDWLWIDTACINKQDGAELSESINSMFSWYGNSSICYAYLADVKPTQKLWSSKLDLMRSQWFKRGWTLQELLAPRTVVFVANDWSVIGHKCAYSDKVCNAVCQGFGDRLNKSIAHITGIPQNIINSSMAHELRAVPVEDKLAWAKKRITTRTEDQAYCLLGLLDVFISPIYGEGENAWARLVQALEYKQSLQTSGPAAKASRSTKWFRLRGAKKEVKQEGRYASATTMTTVVSGYTSAPCSVPPQRPMHSESAVIRPPVSVPVLSRPAQSMGFMGVRSSSPPSAPQIGRSPPSTNSLSSRMPSAPQFGGYTQSTNAMYYESGALSAPADADMYLTPAGLDSAIYHEDGAISAPAGPLTGYVAALRSGVTQQTHQTYLAPGATTMGAANTKTTDQYWGIIEEEPTLVSSNSKLKHRYGSGWSFHDAETGYNSQWIHELEDTSLSMGTKHIFEPLGTAVIVRNVTALFDFIPDAPDELAFTKGNTISVIESVFQDWWRGSLGGRTGIFPLNYVQKLDPRVDDLGSVVTSESTEVVKVVRGPANISTLMEGRRPDVDDWLKHDGLSPGLMGNFQWQRLSTTYIDVEAELTRGDEIEARPGTPKYEMPKAAATSLKQRPVSAQLGRKLVNDSVLGKRFKKVIVEQPVSPLAVGGSEHQNQQLINAIAASSLVSEHHKPTPQGLPSTLPATSTAIIQPIPQRQKLPAGIALNKLNTEDNDGDSIQADDFWAECWQPPVLTRVTTLEQTKQDEAPPQSAVVMKQVTTNTTVSPPTEVPDTIHIPRIVLKALLEQQARPIAGPSNETELLANTAVEYIRELLLSQNGAQNSLQAKPSGVVESVEIKTAKYEATSVTQMLSATATNMTKGERVVEVSTTELPDTIATA